MELLYNNFCCVGTKKKSLVLWHGMSVLMNGLAGSGSFLQEAPRCLDKHGCADRQGALINVELRMMQ